MKRLILLAVLLLVTAAPVSSTSLRLDGPDSTCQPTDPICIPPA